MAKAHHKFKFLDHSHQLKLQVWGDDLEELFISAAFGMMSFLYPKHVTFNEHELREKIRLTAADLKELLNDWLIEILELTEKRGACFNDFDFDLLNDRELIVTAFGHRAHAKQDIKSVTKKNTQIKKEDDELIANISFDF